MSIRIYILECSKKIALVKASEQFLEVDGGVSAIIL
jgi:hypothetical protein